MAAALVVNWSPVFAEPASRDEPSSKGQKAIPRTSDADDDVADEDDDPPPRKPAARKARRLTDEQKTPTHKQVRIIKPAHGEKPVSLATFCLAQNGNILACVATNSPDAGSLADDDAARNENSHSFVQEYAPDGTLVRETAVPFSATAINVSPSGGIFIAGDGKMARIIDGKVIGETPTPNIGNQEEFKKQVLEAAKEEVAEYSKQFEDQICELKKRVESLESKSEKQELTKREAAQLKSLKQSLEVQEQQIKSISEMFGNPETQVRQRLVVTALGVTEGDVFVSVMSAKGHGYEVWRTDHEFKEPTKVVASLSGCCGQMDIQARDDRLFVAENGNFQVSIRDRDGKRLSSFGKRDRGAVDGFGSCCNPMNVRCCDNGDILTAESSIGNIKRFNAAGEFVGFIGKAKIGIGCKHVALAFDESLNRYYMMNVDKDHIAVLIPIGDIPPETQAEKAARAARDEFSKGLVGQWEREGREVKKKTARNPLNGLIGSLLGSGDDNDDSPENFREQPFDAVTFSANGKIKAVGGMLGMYSSNYDLSWEAVSLKDKVLEVAFNMDGAEFTSARVEIVSDDEIEVRAQTYGSGEFGKPYKFKRKGTAARPKPGTTAAEKTP
jgi:hypothetical protein